MFFAPDDKRSFQRMELELPIEITKGTVAVKGICKDLSSTGMLITFSDTRLHAGDEVHIKLDTSDERFPPLDADATLLRVDEQEIGFSAAVNFITLK
ncbi:PilZ domain-containing protein [Psychromonas sp. Urea-02u-13]|uniref:PilZ domain-containing protein n=1 Tax=Psychromonas sp. Urea-02u-13 TaxID=2058326 RepID=UPI000C33A922|nr:PilZ domain-containing protein [Psychromonas sp. Urea-02u-13]PKG40286.1 PilZ domain-containing protein [Psychromonas sp. Urea-02u-13]